MGLFNRFLGLFRNEGEIEASAVDIIQGPIDSLDNEFLVNPATGYPMINGINGIDVVGNPFGVDLDDSDSIDADDNFHDDPFDSLDNCGLDDFCSLNNSCGIDDPFSSDDW